MELLFYVFSYVQVCTSLVDWITYNVFRSICKDNMRPCTMSHTNRVVVFLSFAYVFVCRGERAPTSRSGLLIEHLNIQFHTNGSTKIVFCIPMPHVA